MELAAVTGPGGWEKWGRCQVLHLGSSTWEQLLHGLSEARDRCQEQAVERDIMGHQMGPCDLALLSA